MNQENWPSRKHAVLSAILRILAIGLVGSALWTAFVLWRVRAVEPAKTYTRGDRFVEDGVPDISVESLVIVTKDDCELCAMSTSWFSSVMAARKSATVVHLRVTGEIPRRDLDYGILRNGLTPITLARVSSRIPRFPAVLLVDNLGRIVDVQFGRSFPEVEARLLERISREPILPEFAR